MNSETTGAFLVVVGALALIMAVKGSWDDVWHALVPSSKASAGKKGSNALASFNPGGVTTAGGGTTDGSGRPGASPAPLAPGGSSYDALVRGALRFAGVDQGIDFTGPGQILAPIAGIVRRAQRSGSGWPGEGAFELLQLDNGRYMYVAEDFAPTVPTGARVSAGDVIGRATGSGRAPGIEVGWADSQGHALSPLYPNPHSPKPSGYDFQRWILGRQPSSVGGLLA